MPVPIPGSKVGSDSQKVKFLTISGRPKTGFFGKISGVLGRAPLATNHAVLFTLLFGCFAGIILYFQVSVPPPTPVISKTLLDPRPKLHQTKAVQHRSHGRTGTR